MHPHPTFSPQEVDKINDDYWTNGLAHCPDDGAELNVLVSESIGHPKGMRAFCPACPKQASFQSARDEGTPFTDAEMKEYIYQAQRGAHLFACPNDGTRMLMEESPHLGGPITYAISCRRCGAHGEYYFESTS